MTWELSSNTEYIIHIKITVGDLVINSKRKVDSPLCYSSCEITEVNIIKFTYIIINVICILCENLKFKKDFE